MTLKAIVLGTANAKKGLELAELVTPLGLRVYTLADFPPGPPVEETGETFAENAILKAKAQALRLREWVLADDSGLAVDSLAGAPGVHSARYAGPLADDAANNEKLLQALSGLPPDQRAAHYVCHLALADPTGVIRAQVEESCRGRIVSEYRGGFGFGYDPLFEIVEYHRTFGELAPAVKARLSHRARALRRIIPALSNPP